MEAASRAITIDQHVVRYPDRYMDEGRGEGCLSASWGF